MTYHSSRRTYHSSQGTYHSSRGSHTQCSWSPLCLLSWRDRSQLQMNRTIDSVPQIHALQIKNSSLFYEYVINPKASCTLSLLFLIKYTIVILNICQYYLTIVYIFYCFSGSFLFSYQLSNLTHQ